MHLAGTVTIAVCERRAHVPACMPMCVCTPLILPNTLRCRSCWHTAGWSWSCYCCKSALLPLRCIAPPPIPFATATVLAWLWPCNKGSGSAGCCCCCCCWLLLLSSQSLLSPASAARDSCAAAAASPCPPSSSLSDALHDCFGLRPNQPQNAPPCLLLDVVAASANTWVALPHSK